MKRGARWTLWRGMAVAVAAVMLVSTGPAVAADVHKIGAVLPFTGSAASYGEWMRNGSDIAIEEINQEWAKKGKRLELIYEDSRSGAKDAVTAMNKLVSVDKVPAVMATLSPVTKALKPLADQSRVILTTSATLPGLTEGSRYTFRNATNLSSEIKTLVTYAAGKYKTVAIVWANLEHYKFGESAFIKSFQEKGGKVVASESFDPNAVDVRSQLTKIKQVNPDALLVLAYKTTAVALKQARELGIKADFIGTLDFELPEVVQIAREAAEGSVYTKAAFEPNRPYNDVMRQYVQKYRARYNAEPEVYGATHYDMLRILAMALDAAGPDADKMRTFILGVKNYPGASGATTFLPNGDVEKPVELKTIKGGKHLPFR